MPASILVPSSCSNTLPCLCRFLRLQVPCASSNPSSEVQVWAPLWLEPYILQATQEGIGAYLPAGWLSMLHPSQKSVYKFPPLVKMLQRSLLAWPIWSHEIIKSLVSYRRSARAPFQDVIGKDTGKVRLCLMQRQQGRKDSPPFNYPTSIQIQCLWKEIFKQSTEILINKKHQK